MPSLPPSLPPLAVPDWMVRSMQRDLRAEGLPHRRRHALTWLEDAARAHGFDGVKVYKPTWRMRLGR